MAIDRENRPALSGGEFFGSIHRWAARVFYADTDALGVMYHGAYLDAAERARTEMLHALACGYRRYVLEAGMAFAVRRLGADYRQPLRLDDVFEIESVVADVSGARIDMGQRMILEGRTRARIDLQLVCVDHRGRARRLPAAIADALSAIRVADEPFGQPLPAPFPSPSLRRNHRS